MKRILMTACAAALLWSCNGKKTDEKTTTPNTTENTEVKKEGETAGNTPAPVLDSATKAKNMMTYGMPGDAHKMMAKWDGNWTAEVKFYMPGAPEPMVTTLKTVNKMVNNGLVQQSTHNGTMMGMPFNGVSQTGYDNLRKVLWSTWMDNMSSGLVYMEGTWDDATKSMNLKGKMTDPETGMQMDMREVMKIVDDNTQMMEQYLTHDGKENKSMDITFKRAK
jgi:hypothetical protein